MDKKELKKKYKETVQPMGVYQIRNMRNGKIFIESAKNLPGIINSHKFQLKNGSHMNKELQKDFKEVGEAGFSFDILDRIEPKEDPNYDYTMDLETLKEMWLEKLQPFDEKGYNPRKNRKNA